jgi:uroporphyrinogen-III synthase
MANWIHKLDLKDLFDAYDNKEKTTAEVGKETAKRLRALHLPEDFQSDQEDIAGMFEEVETQQEFNEVLNELYDLGDCPLPTPKGQMERKLIWIATTF